MITGISESKTLTKHISCECKCKFDERKCSSNQWWNNNKYCCDCKKHICDNDYVWNPATCNCENGEYLVSIMDDSRIICYEVIESHDKEIKTIATNFNEKYVARKTHFLCFTCIFINYLYL